MSPTVSGPCAEYAIGGAATAALYPPRNLEILMKLAPCLLALALTSAFAATSSAQTAASSPTRAEVKAQAAAANKAGTIPSGQESVVGQDIPRKPKTDTSRATVKSQAAAANKAGTIPSGQESVVRQDIPKKVSINEAIEIARRFGDKESPAFVNGILDEIESCPKTEEAGEEQ